MSQRRLRVATKKWREAIALQKNWEEHPYLGGYERRFGFIGQDFAIDYMHKMWHKMEKIKSKLRNYPQLKYLPPDLWQGWNPLSVVKDTGVFVQYGKVEFL